MATFDELFTRHGIPALLSGHGETVQLNGENIEAMVETGIQAELEARGVTDFLPDAGSEVQIPVTPDRPPPQVGQTIIDALGRQHRILRTSRASMVYHCACQMSDPPAGA